MKRFWTVLFCAAVLCAFCLTAGCCAEAGGSPYAGQEQAVSGAVIATGDVNLRSGPGLDYDTLGVMRAGEERAYTGKTSVDGRGVAWYSLDFGGREAWASSKYTRLETCDEAGSFAEPGGLTDAGAGIEAGAVLTEAQIQAAYGVFNFNRTINTTGVEVRAENGLQCFRLSFAPDVYYGGTSGYGERWLSEGGIAAERDADLDGDGVDEHLVFVLANKVEADRDEPEICCTAAIFEPVPGGYVLGDSFDFSFEWGGEGSRFVRLVDGERGMHIMSGSIAYWDAGTGGIYADLYGYDGKDAYADMIVFASTWDGYCLEKRIDVELMEEYRRLCRYYEDADAEARAMGIVEGENLIWYDCEIFEPMYGDGEINPGYFRGIEACGAAVQPYGLELGYVLYMRDDGHQTYDLLLDGGDELIRAEEGCDPEDWRNAFIDLRLNSTLTHVY